MIKGLLGPGPNGPGPNSPLVGHLVSFSDLSTK